MTDIHRHPRTSATLQSLSDRLSSRAMSTLKALADFGDNPHLTELRLTPPEILFSKEEIEQIERVERSPIQGDSLHPHTVIILKATRLCNLRCAYCNSWREGPGQVMEFDTLLKVMYQSLTTPSLQALDIVWHGGEVTLLPPRFLLRALWLQERFRPPHLRVFNSIQTNATKLTDEWIAFLRDYRLSVGVSIDGPPEIHDARRRDKAGKGTWQDVKSGIGSLRAEGVPFGVLAVVDECIIRYGAEGYLAFLAELQVKSFALLNALPPNDSESANPTAYLDWDHYQSFMRDMFRIWWSRYRDMFVLRELQALVNAARTGATGLCLYARNCMGQYLTIEPSGDVTACDKYVGDPGLRFGSLRDQDLNTILRTSRNLAKARDDVAKHKQSVSKCEYFHICTGGCPHDARLNAMHLGRANESCCGLKCLIGDIVSTVNPMVVYKGELS